VKTCLPSSLISLIDKYNLCSEVYEQYPQSEHIVIRFGYDIPCDGRSFNRKTLTVAAGTPLPTSFRNNLKLIEVEINIFPPPA
jgi:hypothetical protein